MTAACESVTCTRADYQKTQLLAAQLCNPTYTNTTASSVSGAIASAVANATAATAGKDETDPSSYPPCAENCINQYLPQSGCGSLANRLCVCRTSGLNQRLSDCEAPTCSAEDKQVISYLSYKLCTSVGGIGNSSNVSTPTSVPPVATFAGDGVSIFAKGVGWMAFAVVGGLVIGF